MAIQRHYPKMKVEYQAARTVDADKIYLSNERLQTIWKEPMVSIEEGIERYYHYLKEEEEN